MGDAAIWVYWGGLTPLDKIAIPEVAPGVSDLQIAPQTMAARAARWSGALHIRQGARYDAVRLVIAGVAMDSEPELYRDLRALEEHLKANHPLALALDEDKAWAAYVTVTRGATAIAHTGNDWAAFNASAALSGGDNVVVRSMGATAGWREELSVNAVSGSTINTFPEKVRFFHGPLTTLVRHEHFWPVLRLQDAAFDRPLLTVESGRTFSFAADLYEDLEALIEANGQTQQLASANDSTAAGKVSTSTWGGGSRLSTFNSNTWGRR